MLQFGARLLKRFVVLIPGIIIAFFSVQTVFPFFDRHIPLSLAIFVTYVLGAYVLIPAIIRAVRIVRPTDHLPLYCVTPDGFASDPLNVGILATRMQLISVMETAGWHVADPHTLRNMARSVISTIVGAEYPTSPVSSLYLFGRKQDIAFEIPITGSLGNRHHVRFWATTYEEHKRLTVRKIHWHHRRAHVQGDNLLWVGASSLDVGVTLIRHNFQLTHMVHPDTDRERELIINQLKAKKLVAETTSVHLEKPYRLVNRVWRGYLQTDGKMTVVKLKKKH
jgi:hypothetical protein